MATAYTDICDRVWRMYEELRSIKTPRGGERRVLLPPPARGHRVDLLIVGMSPNNGAKIRYGATRKEAERFAAEMEYVSGRGPHSRPLVHDPYYLPLLKLARKADPSLGTWWQIEEGQSSLLVEFSDLLHVATDPGGLDIKQFRNQSELGKSLLKECLEILQMEILLHQPRCVLCNGDWVSQAVFGMCQPKGYPPPPATTHLVEPRLGCTFHFIDFYREENVTPYSQQRIANEIRQHLFSRA